MKKGISLWYLSGSSIAVYGNGKFNLAPLQVVIKQYMEKGSSLWCLWRQQYIAVYRPYLSGSGIAVWTLRFHSDAFQAVV